MAADTRHLDYIDALRGYAILGVVAVHASIAVPDLEWPLRFLAEQGARGVQLFFVVSALTLMLSWHARDDGELSIRPGLEDTPFEPVANCSLVSRKLRGE